MSGEKGGTTVERYREIKTSRIYIQHRIPADIAVGRELPSYEPDGIRLQICVTG